MAASTVTISVEELAKLVKHGDNSLFFYNLPRAVGQYHRCVRIEFLESGGLDGTSLRFTIEVDGAEKQTVTHRLVDVFDLLPRLSAWLAEQA